MSNATKRTAKTKATWWKRVTANSEFSGIGGGISYVPKLINVSFMLGGSQTYVDSKGVQFNPEGRLWFEALDDGNPQVGDFISLGDHVLQDDPTQVDGAKEIRKSELQDCSLLNEKDDYYVVT
tara:strand:- start:42143 stop:42511 length:369 start_codon:yes stop_codon:yes gene_type:complete